MKTLKCGIGAAGILAALLFPACSTPAIADTLPGTGRTIRYVQADSLGANYVADQIVAKAMQSLGYDVKLSTMNITLFFAAVAQGDVDLSTDVNLPQREPEYRAVEKQAEIIGTGFIAGGGVNGYMIDKKTAEAHHITSLEQMKDPNVAGLFGDGGKAELISCDPGWSCADVVNYQVKKFGLTQNVHVVSGKYEALMTDVVSRIKSGSPAFFYAWSPSWVTSGLVPGKDVVWLPVPSDALPPKMPNSGSALVKGVVGCAGGADPCHMAMASWNAGSVANRTFASTNPGIKALIQQIKFPPAVWADWEAAISKEHNSTGLYSRLADQWLAANRTQFTQWVATARAAQ